MTGGETLAVAEATVEVGDRETEEGLHEDAPEMVFLPDTELVDDLRGRGFEPFTWDTDAIRWSLETLAVEGRISDERQREIGRWLGTEDEETPFSEILRDSRLLDATWTAESYLQDLARRLTLEELEFVLTTAGGFEVEATREALRELSASLAKEISLVEELEQKLFYRVGVEKITDPEIVAPGLVNGSQASRPGLGGQIEDPARLKMCSELATKFNGDLNAARLGDKAAEARATALATRVVEACFYPATSDSLPQLDAFGVIFGPGILCGAVLARADAVVTARHCIYQKATDRQRDLSSLRFFSWRDPSRALGLTATWDPVGLPGKAASRYHPKFDFVGVELDGTVKIETPVCWDRLREEKEVLGLAGYLPVLPAEPAASWREKTVVSTSGVCFAREVREDCFVHYCQAMGAFSGTPVFAGPTAECAGGIRVVGLHLGEALEGAGCTDNKGNQGVGGVRVASLLGL